MFRAHGGSPFHKARAKRKVKDNRLGPQLERRELPGTNNLKPSRQPESIIRASFVLRVLGAASFARARMVLA